MPRGRPRRESTGSTVSVDSTSASPRRRRAANWNSDNVSRLLRSSLDVLLAWFTAPGNYTRWTDARSNLKERLALCHEINEELRSEGITHRQDMDIYAKFGVVERSFLSAKKWLEETALLPTFLDGKAGKEIEANVRQLCPHYKVLAPAFAASKNESAAATVVDIDDDDSDDDDEENDDDDEPETAARQAPAKVAATARDSSTDDSSSSDSDETQLGADDDTHASLDATATTASSVVVSAPTDAVGAFELSESSQPTEQSIVRDSASTPSKSQDGAVSDDRTRLTVHDSDEETKESEPVGDARRTEPLPHESAVVRSPPKQLKRLRQRTLPQPQLTDDELSSPSTPANFKPPRARKPSLTPPSSSACKSSVSPAKAPTDSPARTPLSGSTPRAKQSIAPKRKTSGSSAVTLSSSSASSATPPSARKKQKTASPVVTKPTKRVAAMTAASKPKTLTPVKKTTTPVKASAAALHPDELAAILRASEEEREQRNALFALQCDKLMQELEEKKVQVVYETAVARKKLLDLGVAQSEVDRILPL